jgi:alanine dehydrogenase
MSIASCIIRDEHTPELTARRLMRRHLRGGVVIDVPIAGEGGDGGGGRGRRPRQPR